MASPVSPHVCKTILRSADCCRSRSKLSEITPCDLRVFRSQSRIQALDHLAYHRIVIRALQEVGNHCGRRRFQYFRQRSAIADVISAMRVLIILALLSIAVVFLALQMANLRSGTVRSVFRALDHRLVWRMLRIGKIVVGFAPKQQSE